MATTDKRDHWLSVIFPAAIDFPGNTEGLICPSGTTAERPASPVNGTIRYNTSGNIIESYVNGTWENLLGTVGGVNDFTDLTDTFADYTGRANQILRVNIAETGLDSIDGNTVFLPLAGGLMGLGANITLNGAGELLGLPATPTTANAATSKLYVDQAIINDGGALFLALAGGTMTGAIAFNTGQLFPYDNSGSFLTATDVNAAIDEVEDRVDTIESAGPYLEIAGGTMAGNIDMSGGSEMVFVEFGGGTDSVSFKAPAAIATSVVWTLPNADGGVGEFLSTNGAGTLSWAAAGGGGSSDAITDADADTSITVEAAADEDIIRFNTGNAITGFPAITNVMTLASNGLTVDFGTALDIPIAGQAAPVSITSGTALSSGGEGGDFFGGGPITITSGDGFDAGSGGPITITSGDGGSYAIGGGPGGTISILAGAGQGQDAGGGIINITAGNSGTGSANGGDISITGGAAIVGSANSGGDVTIQGGSSDADTGGNIDLQPGAGPVGAATGYVRLLGSTIATVAELRFMEAATTGVDYVGLRAPLALSGSQTYTLPLSDGNSGEILTTDGAGILSFSSVPVAPSFTLATLPAQKTGGFIYVSNATGASLIGSMCFSNGTVWIDVTTGIAVV